MRSNEHSADKYFTCRRPEVEQLLPVLGVGGAGEDVHEEEVLDVVAAGVAVSVLLHQVDEPATDHLDLLHHGQVDARGRRVGHGHSV